MYHIECVINSVWLVDSIWHSRSGSVLGVQCQAIAWHCKMSAILSRLWLIVSWNLRNKLWNLNQVKEVSSKKIDLKMLSGKWQPFVRSQCVYQIVGWKLQPNSNDNDSGCLDSYCLDSSHKNGKGQQDNCPNYHWGHWSLASMSPVMTRAVTLMTFASFNVSSEDQGSYPDDLCKLQCLQWWPGQLPWWPLQASMSPVKTRAVTLMTFASFSVSSDDQGSYPNDLCKLQCLQWRPGQLPWWPLQASMSPMKTRAVTLMTFASFNVPSEDQGSYPNDFCKLQCLQWRPGQLP